MFLERQDGDRRLVGQRQWRRLRRGGRRGGCGGADADAMGVHRPGDVLDLLLAHVLEREGELVAYLVAHHAADADAAGLRQGFESSGDVDAVAEDVAPIDDDVAKIDPDAELDARCGRHLGIAFGQLALNADRAAHGVDDAGKLD